MNKEKRQMSRHGILATVFASIALAAGAMAAPASAEFGLSNFDVTFTNEDGTPATQAGSHPFGMLTSFDVNRTGNILDGQLKDVFVDQAAGFVGDATVVPRCPTARFLETDPGSFDGCPVETAVGVDATNLNLPGFLWFYRAVYNLEPPPGVQARLGFNHLGVFVTIDIGVKQSGDYNVSAAVRNAPQEVQILDSYLLLWGVPADPAHDGLRGICGGNISFFAVEFKSNGTCPTSTPEVPFLTLPRACTGPATTAWRANSWEEPGSFLSGSVVTHDDAEPPNPQGFTGCGKLPFAPAVLARPTSASAESSSGFDFDLEFNQEGLLSTDGLAQSEIKKTVVTLPEGMTINPSVGEGLGFCSPDDFERESLSVEEGDGCPDSSKIGTVEVETPLIESSIEGSVYLAQQGDPETSFKENPFDSLIAFYIVLRNEQENIFVKLPAKVEPDPDTGQLVTTVDDIPQLPFSKFNFRFREGNRAPLTTPPACGDYEVEAALTPHANPDQVRTAVSTFEITGGVDGGSCPPGGVPPFSPHFEAGSINNNAGSYSPFVMRLIRHDGEQDMTKFGSILPPGVVGNLSGVEKCSEAQIGAARAKTGREELASASCPASSQIGTTLAGAGVGPALTYVPGKVYLAGPYKGAPLSVVSVTPAVAGPFDAGDVVVRIALNLDPKTAEVIVDGDSSDPIPHILKGIPLKVRDLRVYIDRENFIINPTSCDESSAKATLFGANLDLFSDADDVPVDLATRYQAANCLNLGFAPKLGLKLKGGTRRGNFPGLKAHYKPFAGHANIKDLVVRLPRSAFLEQGHIRTICTRVQFAADNCPKGAQYGYIRAWTPLLDEPLQGPVWLRSSNHKLPDLVFDLQGIVDVEVQTRIDSVKGGIRARVEDAPDAPISRVILNMQGGKKGLIVNSRNLCTKRKGRANVKGTGQNGKQFTRKPVLRPQCGKRRKAKRSSHSRISRVAKSSAVG